MNQLEGSTPESPRDPFKNTPILRVLSPDSPSPKKDFFEKDFQELVRIYSDSEPPGDESMLLEEEDIFENLNQDTGHSQTKSGTGLTHNWTPKRNSRKIPIGKADNLEIQEHLEPIQIKPDITHSDQETRNQNQNLKKRFKNPSKFKINLPKNDFHSQSSGDLDHNPEDLNTPNPTWPAKFVLSNYNSKDRESECGEVWDTAERLREPGLSVFQRKMLTEEEQQMVVKSYQNTGSRHSSNTRKGKHHIDKHSDDVDLFFKMNEEKHLVPEKHSPDSGMF